MFSEVSTAPTPGGDASLWVLTFLCPHLTCSQGIFSDRVQGSGLPWLGTSTAPQYLSLALRAPRWGSSDRSARPVCREGGVKGLAFLESRPKARYTAETVANASYLFPLHHCGLKLGFSAGHFCPEMSKRIQLTFFEAWEAKRKDCLQP